MKLLIMTLLISLNAHAVIETVTLTSQDAFPSPRWMYGIGAAPKFAEKDPAYALSRVKQAQVDNDFAGCADRARAARSKAKSLQGWLAVVELECAVKVKPSLKSGATLSHAIDDASSHPEWFVIGPQASRLKTAYGLALSGLIDLDLKTNRARAWKSIERIDEFSNVLDDKTKGAAWKSAGQLSEAQAKPEQARDFYKRSLALTADSDTRARLSAVERSLGLSPMVKSTPAPGVSGADDAADTITEATPEESDLADRATSAFKSGDIVVATDDAIQLIQKYPGGARAKWASDRILETLASFADKTDIKYQDLHEQILDRAQKADGDRLAEWARVCYNRAQFQDAFTLAKKSLASMDGARRSKALETFSESAIAVEQWDAARGALQELIDKSAGQPSSRDALFRLGLLNYRQAKYNDAITSFERLLSLIASLPQADSLELGSRYWLWRSLQKTKAERATQVSDDLMAKFPFSYYGLRARLEKGNGTLDWKIAAGEKVESTLYLTGSDKIAWEKAQILLRSGWLEEAQAEIRDLPAPVTANDKAVRALLWAAAGGYVTASKLVNDAWDENSDFRRAPFTGAVFPKEFSDFVDANAKKRGLDRDLVRGLIKQESSFNPKAISSSNAYGLMQMIPPTAREIAQDLHIGTLRLPDDMFVPKRNIEMGTYYLSRQVSHYSGSVPLALASYNAGPGRMDRWLRTHVSARAAGTAGAVSTVATSSADSEIWFDEIPYSETCFYVKAILRNVMLYRLLEEGRVQMPDPIWSQKPVQ